MTTITATRAARVWHTENNHGQWYAVDQWGGFSGIHKTEADANAQIDTYLTDNPEDTRRPYGQWQIERSSDNRSRNATALVETLPDGRELRVRLSVSHWKDSKVFAVHLTRLLREPANGGYFASETYEPMRDTVRLALDPIARFSTKALSDEWDAAVRRATLDLAGDLTWMLTAPADD